MEKSQWRENKSVLLLKESIAIETLQYQYTGRTLKTKSERHVLPFGIRPMLDHVRYLVLQWPGQDSPLMPPGIFIHSKHTYS